MTIDVPGTLQRELDDARIQAEKLWQEMLNDMDALFP